MNTPELLRHFVSLQSRRYTLLCAIQVVIWLLLMLPGLIGRVFFDLLTGHTHVPGGIVGLTVVFVAFEGVLIGSYFLNVAQEAVANSTVASLLRSNLLNEVLQYVTEPMAGGSTGAAVSRFREDADEVASFLSLLTSAIGMGVFVLVGVIIMFSINPIITIAVFLPLVTIVVVVERAASALERYRIQSREATAALCGSVGYAFGAIEAFQAAGTEEHLATHIAALNKTRKDAVVREGLFSQIVGSINAHSISWGTAGILLLAAKEMRSGAFTVGDFALFTFYLGYVTTIIGLVGSMNVAYKKVKVSLVRLAELSAGTDPARLVARKPDLFENYSPTAIPGYSGDPFAVLNAQGLTVRYADTGRGITGCNVEVPRGSLTVVTGRTGSGKTTLLRAIIGLVSLDSGIIEWNGKPVVSVADFFMPPHTAFTPQTPMLFSETIRENILLGLVNDASRLDFALRATALERDLESMEQGLDTILGAHGSRLSGGQTQRVAAARMLLRDAELLVMDDPTSALDVETERHLCDAIRSDGRTFLVASTRSALLLCADTIIVMNDGRVEAQGSLSDILPVSGELRLLLEQGVLA